MSILFAGTELDSFNRSSAAVQESTNSVATDTTYVRASVMLGDGSSTDYADTLTIGGQTGTVWLHFDWMQDVSIRSSSIPLTYYNSSGTAVFQLLCTATSPYTFQAQWWNGSAWTNIGSTFTVAGSTRVTFDIQLTLGSSGSFSLYLANSVITSASSVNLSAISNIDKIRFNSCSPTTSRNTYVSQVIVSTASTVGYKFYSKPPTGNSSVNTAFTNDFTAVDETTLDDGDFIQSTSAGDVETYTHTAFTPSGVVRAVVVSMRIKNDGSVPANAQAALRIGGANYFSANLSGIGLGYGAAQAIWETDPSTSAAWLSSAAGSGSNEFGVKSVT